MGNIELKSLRVALLQPVTIIKTEKEIQSILSTYHDDPIQGGHTGITRTLAKIKRHYYWKNMTRHIKEYIRRCHKCQMSKTTTHTKTPLTYTETPTNAFDIVIVDTVGPLPKSEYGNEYIVTLICDLTKYLVTIPVANKSANTVAKAIFENFILKYGPMKTFISDMGTEYKNNVIQDMCKYMKIENLTSTAYHHQTLGTIERSHRTFNEYIRSYISADKTDWDVWIQYFTYCFNTTPSVMHNYCPYELVFGRLPRQFANFNKADRIEPLYNIEDYSKEIKFRLEIAYKRARLLLEKAKSYRKQLYDKKTSDFQLKIGDKVILRNESGHKLDPVYIGPYTVETIEDRDNIVIRDKKQKKQKVHKDRLQIYNQ
uniref:RNA-directed DNA polymerase n=1 Tax=Drosophila melanogaster TaxID=7227 RepID=Q8SXE4_DROME|nr:RH61266p [Drosophila melanogaster]